MSAYASIQGIDLTVESVKEILGFKEGNKKITQTDIINACAEYFGTTYDSVIGNQRSSEIKAARQMSIYLIKEILNLSYPVIASTFNKNHTTILYSYEKMKKDLKTDKTLQEKAQELEISIRK